MTTSETLIPEVKKIIKSAFQAVQYPGDDNLLHSSCFDGSDLEIFQNQNLTHWNQVKPEHIEFQFENLVILSPQAFQFFLPAYMLHGLDNPDGNVLLFTLYSLIATSNSENPKALKIHSSQFSYLTDEQKEAVKLFLECVRDHYLEYGLREEACEALESYWSR